MSEEMVERMARLYWKRTNSKIPWRDLAEDVRYIYREFARDDLADPKSGDEMGDFDPA